MAVEISRLMPQFGASAGDTGTVTESGWVRSRAEYFANVRQKDKNGTAGTDSSHLTAFCQKAYMDWGWTAIMQKVDKYIKQVQTTVKQQFQRNVDAKSGTLHCLTVQ